MVLGNQLQEHLFKHGGGNVVYAALQIGFRQNFLYIVPVKMNPHPRGVFMVCIFLRGIGRMQHKPLPENMGFAVVFHVALTVRNVIDKVIVSPLLAVDNLWSGEGGLDTTAVKWCIRQYRQAAMQSLLFIDVSSGALTM